MSMKFKFALAPIVAMLAITSQMAMAATSADLSVTGKIIPASCDVSIGNGGVINIGTYSKSQLNAASANNNAGYDITPFTITCSAPTLIGSTFTDNRPGTVAANAFSGFVTAETSFGVGLDSKGTPIGAYSMYLYDLEVDGIHAESVSSVDNGSTWAPSKQSVNVTFVDPTAGTIQSWSDTAGAPPIPLTNVSARLITRVNIAPTNNLDTTQVITIDGSGTFELKYL